MLFLVIVPFCFFLFFNNWCCYCMCQYKIVLVFSLFQFTFFYLCSLGVLLCFHLSVVVLRLCFPDIFVVSVSRSALYVVIYCYCFPVSFFLIYINIWCLLILAFYFRSLCFDLVLCMLLVSDVFVFLWLANCVSHV